MGNKIKITLYKHRACRTHCCVIHGCKYSHENCMVFNGEVKQEYLCEYCSDKLYTNIGISETWSKINSKFLVKNRKFKLKKLNEYSRNN